MLSLPFFAFFGLFLVVGLGMLGYGARFWWTSHQVAEWPTAQGTLLERGLIEDGGSDSTTYRVKVRYVYVAAGRNCQSDRLAFGHTGSSGPASITRSTRRS